MPTPRSFVDDWSRINRRSFLSTAAQMAGLATAGALVPDGMRRCFADQVIAASTTTPVTTRSGLVRGRTIDGVHTFLGIPYGAPTGAKRRFLAPMPEQPWTGVRDAFEYAAYAPQSGRGRGAKQLEFFAPLRPASTKGTSEDCLFLNVWTKGLDDGAKRPVMVWLHGGGYDQGSGGSPGYAGDGLARHHDVLAISLNHRLNVLGYLYLGEILGSEFAESANQGQLDIVAALRWVRDHAEAFGGDPNRVMIYGQSGGAGKVVNLLGMPAAKGLFHAAAVQSGGARGGDKARATQSAQELLKALGLTKAAARDLQKVPLERLMAVGAPATPAVGATPARDATGNFRFAPVVDGNVLPDDPNGSPLSQDVPVIVGRTRTERTVYQVDSENYGRLTDDELVAGVTKLVGEGNAAKIIAIYRQEKPKATPFALNLYIDADTRAGDALAVARNKLMKAATYVYRWDWETPVMDLLAPHTMEIPFVMDHLAACTAMTGPVTAPMKELASQTAAAWVSLARTGNPNHKGLPEWPAYREDSKRVLLFDTPCRVAGDPGSELRKRLVPGAVVGPGFGRSG